MSHSVGDCEITASNGKKLVIRSDTSSVRTIDVSNYGRIFKISGGAELTLEHIVLKNGNADTGGAIYVEDGTLTLIGKTVITPSSGADANTPGKNDVYLKNGKKIKLIGPLPDDVATIARITPETYAETTQVLDGAITDGTPPNRNYTKFTVTQPAGSTDVWTIKNDGKLAAISKTITGGPGAWKKLRELVRIAPAGAVITINGEIKATNDPDNSGEIVIDKDLTIKGSNKTSDILNANSNHTGTSLSDAPTTEHRIFKVEDGKTLTLEQLTLKGGKGAVGGSGGGGIYAEGTLIMTDCTVTGNKTEYGNGGGIYAGGTLTMTSVTVTTNETVNGEGGGIYTTGTLTMTDCTLTGNKAVNNKIGGGVYVDNGTFTMKGASCVTPSTAGEANKQGNNDVYLADGKMITIDGELNPAGGIAARITVPDAKYSTSTKVLHGNLTAGTAPNQNYTKFTVTPQTLSGGKILYWEADANGKLMRIVDGVKYPDKAWKALQDVVSVAGSDPITINGRIQATDDSDNKGTIAINGAITIKGKNGRDTDILDAGKKSGRIFSIADNSNSKLNLEKLTLKGGFVNGNDGAAIIVGRSGDTKLFDCIIEDCEALNGGAIAIWNNGKATLTNTDIKNCSAKLFNGNTPPDGSGGAIYAEGGTVIMTNCTLTGNTAENNGGAVYAKKISGPTPILSTVTIEGGTIGGAGTNANKATGTGAGEGLGGGIYIGESCALNLKDYTDSSSNKHGAKVIGNTAKAKGGAIYTKGGKVTMTNCTLKGNEAKSGGAICAEKDGSTSSNVTISGGTIGGTGADANKATGTDSDNGFGGAVFIKGAIVTLNGCTLEGNKAKNGGGVYMEGGNCTLNGSLKNNTTTEPASSYGGSIYLENGTLTMKTGAEISGSEASVSGGGVYISARDGGTASFTMEGGTISGCKVSSAYPVDGGGVCVEVAHGSTGTANFIMQGGSITGCKVESGGLSGSPSGGGVCVKNGATFDMTGGSITGCKAEINHNAGTPESQGGGVYMENSTFNMSGSSSITGCTAESSDSDISGSPSFYGGGVYAAGSTATFTMKDSAVITPSSEVPSGMKRFNDVYLNSGAKITVAGSLTPPGGIAARITPAAYNTTTQVLTAGTGVTLENETYKFAVTPKIVSGTPQPWTVGGNGCLKQGRYTEVPYGKLAAFLANASENEVNYIEVTDISAADLTGTYASPPNPGPLGALLNNNSSKKVALKLPNSISGLTDMSACFSQCENLVSLENFPSGVTDMRACFYGCENLTTVPAIPATVTSMMECFRYCRSLTTVPNIPSGVYDMTRCFQYCEKLQSIKMNCPYGVNFNGAFNGCDALPNGGIKVPLLQLAIYKNNAGTMGTTKEKFSAITP